MLFLMIPNQDKNEVRIKKGVYLGPCQVSIIKLFTKVVNGF